jgi:hypothetical protein
MTNINIYCLFDRDDNFYGAYSSLKAIHRDALDLCHREGKGTVYIQGKRDLREPTLKLLRNIFKGQMNVHIQYISAGATAKILKTKLLE